MNIEAYNLDSLRRIVRRLFSENRRLKQQLKDANIAFDSENPFSESIEQTAEYDPDQGARINTPFITENMVRQFFTMFWGRQDVYAQRGRKGGYFPQCNQRWNYNVCPKQRGEKRFCDNCEYKDWKPLAPETILKHLLGYKEDGSDVIGVYPLFPDGTCRFLVFDFDNHEKGAAQTDYANEDNEWRDEVAALRSMCLQNGITPLVERSRSGRGAHVWIFFRKPIPAALARNFGFMLLDKGSASVNLTTFHYYDRMYPSQDSASSLGNLIALPLQGQALKDGNSAFVDQNWNAYPDQWDVLLNHTPRLTPEDVERCILKWQTELAKDAGSFAAKSMQARPKPWKKTTRFFKEDVIGNLQIVLGDGVYVDTLNLMPRLQNQIRSLAAFDNPVFYKNKKLGYSNYYNFSSVYLGKDVDGYIRIPRGLLETLTASCEDASIPYEISDQREKGRPIRVSFNGDLRLQQDLAAQSLLSHDNGVLSAATAFGKTVVCSYLIAQRKVNTLILLQSKDLQQQWIEELEKFLTIDEEPPTYTTKTGRVKRREGVIGMISSTKKAPTGIVDVALVGSVYSKGRFNDLINSYGMVIMDECHHAASATSVSVLEKVNARYVYGVSATPKRTDDLERVIFMLLGPVRHSFTAKERAIQQGIGHYVYPRYTRIVSTEDSRQDINGAFELISGNEVRNAQIINDVRACVGKRRTPVILTRRKDQAKLLYDRLCNDADNVFLLYGDNSDKENLANIHQMKNIPMDESLILIATGQKIGEGFDFPRLDTLMLAAPVSSPERLEQYAGRLNRDYSGKEDVIIYDYIDSHIPAFDNMYSKRLRTYKRIGFQVVSGLDLQKQSVNAIFDSGNYTDVFERDLIESEQTVVISSPELIQSKIRRLVYLMKPRQEAGVKVTVITLDPDQNLYVSPDFHQELIETLQENGISVVTKEELPEHFAVIDNELVWHGGMNLLGKADVWDNLMRIKSASVAAELLELSLAKNEKTDS